MNEIKKFIDQNKDIFIKELIDFLKIPSISAQTNYVKDIKRAAEYIKLKLSEAGLDKIKLISTKKNPLVYAEKILNENFPTLLIYGHYDVQPPDPYELWETPPFEPTIRNNKLYARGSADDKGQLYIHIAALKTLISLKKLNFNVKFLIEGEEEMGSESLSKFLDDSKNIELLESNGILVSDTEMISKEIPSIPISIRGIICFDIEITSADRDLHSGVYGGAVANPIEVLCKMVSKLKNENGQINIEGFYDDVINYSDEERKQINNKFDLQKYKDELSIKEIFGESNFTTPERTGIRPSLDVNGIHGGYTENEGFKTVLPAKAFAKLSIRIVPNQDPEKIAKIVKTYLEKITPNFVETKINVHEGKSSGVISDTKSEFFSYAKKAVTEVFGKEPILSYEGGSIPIISKMEQKLKVPIVLLGFGLPSDNIHSPNENFDIDRFFIGLDTIIRFYQNFGS